MLKKVFIALACIATLSSCNNEDAPVMPNNGTPEQQATHSLLRSPEEAVDIALDALSILGNQSKSRGEVRNIDFSSPVKIIRSTATSSRSHMNDTLMYVVNYANEQGFAVISANKALQPLIAVTEQGYYDPEEGTEVEPFEWYMNQVTTTLASIEIPDSLKIPSNPLEPQRPGLWYTRTVEDTIEKFEHTPRINLKWGQSGIYGQYCPNGVCGCTPLAIGMAMTSVRKPSSIQITFDSQYAQNMQLNWDEINQHTFGEYYYSCSTCGDNATKNHNTIGLLLRQIGYLASSTYFEDAASPSTSTTIAGAEKALSSLRIPYQEFNSIPTFGSDNDIYLVFGLVKDSNGEPSMYGHTWICDGDYYCHRLVKSQKCEYLSLSDKGWITYQEVTVKTSLKHYNWGWNGQCNGYFRTDLPYPGAPYQYHPGPTGYDDPSLSNTSNYRFHENLTSIRVY